MAYAAAHTHDPKPLAWTTEGVLKVLMGCSCGKTQVVKANPRLRKLPWGFTETTWGKFLEAGKKRLEA